jgi:ABC-type enterochelin transport system substrate-binding protein
MRAKALLYVIGAAIVAMTGCGHNREVSSQSATTVTARADAGLLNAATLARVLRKREQASPDHGKVVAFDCEPLSTYDELGGDTGVDPSNLGIDTEQRRMDGWRPFRCEYGYKDGRAGADDVLVSPDGKHWAYAD